MREVREKYPRASPNEGFMEQLALWVNMGCRLVATDETYKLFKHSQLEKIRREYSSGKMLTGEVKKVLIELLQKLVKRHQEARALVTEEMVGHKLGEFAPTRTYYGHGADKKAKRR